jgi:predicted permease
LWLLDTLIATYGVLFALNLTADIWKPLIGETMMIRIVLTPYYPFTLFFALLVGFWGCTRFRGSYRFWVWVLPAAFLLHSLLDWRTTSQSAWSGTLFHFFGFLPYPDNLDQLDTSLLLYVSIAYMLGAWLHSMVAHISQQDLHVSRHKGDHSSECL